MNIRKSRSFKLLAIAHAVSASLAFAQEDVETTSETSEEEMFEQIIVTATKRSQTLQEVPAAVTNVDGELLVDAGVSDIAGLQYIVPNLSLGDTFSFANLFSRGLGLNTSFGNVDPSVALYSDGAVIAQAGAQLF